MDALTRPALTSKRARDSYTEQVHILMPEHINGAGRLFGGKLLSWIDVVAGVAARRHSGHDVTTACVDNLQFLAPAHINDTIVITARVTWTGRTSMEVRVDTFAERLTGERELVNRAYCVMVALDEREKPCAVPPLACLSDEEKAEYTAGQARSDARRSQRNA